MIDCRSIHFSKKPIKPRSLHDSKQPKRSFADLMKKRKPQPKQKKTTLFDLEKKQQPAAAMSPPSMPFQNLPALGDSPEGQQFSITSGRTFSISGSDFYSQFATNVADYVHTQIESKNGISITTVTIQTGDPFSHFNDIQITIKHYDTSPHSFTIDLTSAPEATELLSKRLTALKNAINNKLPHFDVHISPPALFIIQKKQGRFSTIHGNKTKNGKSQPLISAISNNDLTR